MNAETLVLVPDPGLSFCLSLRMVHYELVRQTSTAHRPQLTSDHERARPVMEIAVQLRLPAPYPAAPTAPPDPGRWS